MLGDDVFNLIEQGFGVLKVHFRILRRAVTPVLNPKRLASRSFSARTASASTLTLRGIARNLAHSDASMGSHATSTASMAVFDSV